MCNCGEGESGEGGWEVERTTEKEYANIEM